MPPYTRVLSKIIETGSCPPFKTQRSLNPNLFNFQTKGFLKGQIVQSWTDMNVEMATSCFMSIILVRMFVMEPMSACDVLKTWWKIPAKKHAIGKTVSITVPHVETVAFCYIAITSPVLKVPIHVEKCFDTLLIILFVVSFFSK